MMTPTFPSTHWSNQCNILITPSDKSCQIKSNCGRRPLKDVLLVLLNWRQYINTNSWVTSGQMRSEAFGQKNAISESETQMDVANWCYKWMDHRVGWGMTESQCKGKYLFGNVTENLVSHGEAALQMFRYVSVELNWIPPNLPWIGGVFRKAVSWSKLSPPSAYALNAGFSHQ